MGSCLVDVVALQIKDPCLIEADLAWLPLAFPSPDGAAAPLKFGIAPDSKHATNVEWHAPTHPMHGSVMKS